jgi:transposase InsO family protein
LSLCLAADDPASDPLVVASLPLPSRDLASAPGRRNTPAKHKFKGYPIGYFHIDIAEVRTEEGKLYLFVAIDRTAKFAFVALHEKSDRPTAARFLGELISAVPYQIHTVLTDNGLQFTDLPRIRNGEIARHRFHPFDEICRASGIEHRLTKPNHPWTTGKSSG